MIKLLNKEDSIYEYLIYDLDTEYINGLRRVLYSNLKSHRIDVNSTVITKNNTNINNEIITHRLSLIPIYTNKKLDFTLHKKNNTDSVMHVYSDDLKTKDLDFQISKGILLHKLKPTEELNLVTSTIESSGKKHTSFRPFSICHFKIMKFIYVKNNVENKINQIKNIIQLYDTDLDKFQKIEGYNLIGYTNEIRDYNDPLKKIFESKEDYLIKEIEYNNKFVYYFTIELYFDDDNIIHKSIDLLKDDLNEFLEQKIEVLDDDTNLKLRVEGGKYHILNILSKYLRNYKNLYSVYNKEHPLRDEILLEYKLNDENKDYQNYLKKLVFEITENLSNIIVS